MKIELTEKQYRRLLDMVYIGNWILNSARGADRFSDYDEVESLLFRQSFSTGMTDLAFLHDLLMNRSALELEKWNLFLNCCSPRMAETIAQGIHTAAPHCGVFRMPELPDPLALTQVPAFVDEFYAHISNGQHLEGKVRRG